MAPPPPTTAGLRLRLLKALIFLLGYHKAWTVLFGFVIVVVGIGFAGAIIAEPWLPSPFFQIVQLSMYGMFVAWVADRLHACFRAARIPQQRTQLWIVTLFLVMIVLGACGRIAAAFRTEDRDYVTLAIDFLPLAALLTALDLVAASLKAPEPTSEGSKEGLPPVPILHIGCAGQALIWIGATVVSLVVIVASPAGGGGMFGRFPKWLAALCIIPFVLGSLLAVAWLILEASIQRQARLGVGQTMLEVSDHPLVPGDGATSSSPSQGAGP
jgi:hypothetical protein